MTKETLTIPAKSIRSPSSYLSELDRMAEFIVDEKDIVPVSRQLLYLFLIGQITPKDDGHTLVEVLQTVGGELASVDNTESPSFANLLRVAVKVLQNAGNGVDSQVVKTDTGIDVMTM